MNDELCDICQKPVQWPRHYGEWQCPHCNQPYAYDEGFDLVLTDSQLAILRHPPRWISVTERLPDHGDTVWCFDADGVGLCEYHGPHSGFQTYGASCDIEGLHSETLLGVTHWMELRCPEPPEVK